MKDDFYFLTEISTEFFSGGNVIKKLNHFHEHNIKGWEVWLQVEFAIFLYQHGNVSEVVREHRFDLDKRKSQGKNICAVDFLIKQKYKQSSIPLEIKQHVNASDCIRYMIKDIDKYERIKGSSSATGRSLWCLGVHTTVQNEYLEGLIKENKFRTFHPDLVQSSEIIGTPYTFTLF